MNGISAPLTISIIAFFMLEMTTTSLFLLPSITFESALAQTEMSIQEDGNNNLGNNTITYSYNIYSNNMIQEWFGLNEHIKNQADILAKEGYVVLAVDLYRGEVTADFNRAMELTSSVRNDPASAIDNLQSAVNYIKSLEMVDGNRIASLGWCFGGDWSLQLALN